MDTIKRIQDSLADFRETAFSRIRQSANFHEAANIVAEVQDAEKEFGAILNKAEKLAAHLAQELKNKPRASDFDLDAL